MIDYPDGVDEMREFVYSDWMLKAPDVVGYLPEMRFQGVEENDPPGVPTFWARMSSFSITDQQATLSTCSVTAYTRRYRDNGRIVIQLFGPRTGDGVYSKLLKLAKVLQARLSGTKTAHNIWFRNARIDSDVRPEPLYNRVNVVCDYERDELR